MLHDEKFKMKFIIAYTLTPDSYCAVFSSAQKLVFRSSQCETLNIICVPFECALGLKTYISTV